MRNGPLAPASQYASARSAPLLIDVRTHLRNQPWRAREPIPNAHDASATLIKDVGLCHPHGMAGTSHPRAKYYTPQAIAAFANEFMRNGGNGTDAVFAIFPTETFTRSRAQTISQSLRKKPEIINLVAERDRRQALALTDALDRYGATSDRTGEELARLAFAQVRDVVDWFTVTDPKTKTRKQVVRVRDASEISEDAHRAIAKITARPDGTITIELGDKLAALNSLARLKGWIADKPQDTGQSVNLIIQR